MANVLLRKQVLLQAAPPPAADNRAAYRENSGMDRHLLILNLVIVAAVLMALLPSAALG